MMNSFASKPLAVVKVGGSLFDLPDLSTRLSTFLATMTEHSPLLIPGGGATADVVRSWDKTHDLGEESSHWLALAALAVNARFLARIVPNAQIVGALDSAAECWQRHVVPVLDMCLFARGDDVKDGALPHTWAVTSDSLAARVAVVGRAQKLVLLKSIAIAEAPDWVAASRAGHVDAYFPSVVANANSPIEAIDFRNWPSGK